MAAHGPRAEEPAYPARTLAEAAATALHRMILSGRLPAGARLRLTELAELLGMSPMPVREGLRRLAALGLVEIEPHKGARVRELSIQDLDDTYATRQILEQSAVRRAAAAFATADARSAEEALARHLQLLDAGEVDAARQAHAEFHFTIYRAAGSRWLLHAIEPVWRNSERYRFALAGGPALHEIRREHQAILDACVARDAEAASAALRQHLDAAAHRIRAAMTEPRSRP